MHSFFIEYSASFDPVGVIDEKETYLDVGGFVVSHKSGTADLAETTMVVAEPRMRQGNFCLG